LKYYVKDNLDKFGSAGKINTVLTNEVKIKFLPRHDCLQRTPGKVGLNVVEIIKKKRNNEKKLKKLASSTSLESAQFNHITFKPLQSNKTATLNEFFSS
jgi:hypothetical protein